MGWAAGPRRRRRRRRRRAAQEGRNAERFSYLYGDRAEILVPRVYWDAVSARVLTMQWVDGTKLSDQATLKAQGLDVLKLVDIGIQCSLRQLLEHGYFHAARPRPPFEPPFQARLFTPGSRQY